MSGLDLPAWLVLLLVVLATARTWRLTAVDEITAPIHEWVLKETSSRSRQWLARLYFCPYCAGFYITALWLGSALLWSQTWVWQLLAGSLGLNYVQAHLNNWLES